jgi:hypothetical protein
VRVDIPDCRYCGDAPEGCDVCKPLDIEIVPGFVEKVEVDLGPDEDEYRAP